MVILNSKDQLKIDVVSKVSRGKISRRDAQNILNVSERTLRRYLRSFERNGVLFIQHGNYRRGPINKTPSELRFRALGLVRELYYDHNRTHALEKLEANHNIKINKDTFNRWCNQESILTKKMKRKRKKGRYRRPRMKRKGLLLQMDGSYERWFGNTKSCLITLIDDADNEIIMSKFCSWETTENCMEVVKKAIEKKGLFQVLYVDKAGVFGKTSSTTKRKGFSQLKRALNELGIQIIYAHSPEAKGRVERLFNTLQDRLIPELRLNRVWSMIEANRYLQNIFIPEIYDKKFKKEPEENESSFDPIPFGVDLNEIFCIKLKRRVKQDHTISWKGVILDIDPSEGYLAGKEVEIRSYSDGSKKVYYDGKEIKLLGHELKEVV